MNINSMESDMIMYEYDTFVDIITIMIHNNDVKMTIYIYDNMRHKSVI